MADVSILVVDDSPTILKLVQLVLTKAGYRVATAPGGEAGLLAAKDERPTLVLLDYLMPDLNGDDVCRAMSGDTVLATIPVIVMSARDEEVGERFARITNVVDYITKPFSPDALLAVVDHTLQKRHGEPAEASRLAISPAEDSPRGDGRVPTTDFALAGDLGVISIADILTLLQDQAQTGLVTMARGEAGLDVYLRSGRIDFAAARGVPEEFLLGRFLVEARLLTPAALAAVVAERKTVEVSKRELLGADLISRGLVSAEGLRRAMGSQTLALVYEGLRWGGGRFSFRQLEELPATAREAALDLPVDALVMEGLRRVDEWRLIEREIGDFDRVFVRNDDKVAAFGRGKLLREEVTVLELVNGRNAVKDIVLLSKMGSFDVTKMLYRLLRNKLIRRRVAPVVV